MFINHAYNDGESLDMLNECITNRVDSLTQYEAFKIEKDGDSLRLVQWDY